MVLDLNKCLFAYSGDGQLRTRPMRYLAVVDGIIGGEGNGPMAPDARPTGVIIAGSHPTAVDCTAATVMGFDWQRLRMLRGCFELRERSFVPFTAEAMEVVSNHAAWQGKLSAMTEVFDFKPHFGWTGAIESDRRALTA